MFSRLVLGCTLLATVGGCVDQALPTTPDARGPEDILWTLQLSPRGITIAAGQEHQLTVTPRNILGDPMVLPDSVRVTYRMLGNDTSRVQVNSAGGIRAKTATPVTVNGPTPAGVIATVQYGAITKADTIYVAVTATAPSQPAASLSIAPAAYPADSSWGAFFTSRVIPVTVRTADGTLIPNAYAFVYSNQRRRQLTDIVSQPRSRSMLYRLAPGKFWLYASAWVYGVELQDSVQYTTLDMPGYDYRIQTDQLGRVVVDPNYTAAPAAPCASLVFTNALTTPVIIRFDAGATAVCTTGDVAGDVTIPPNGTVIRKIKQSGQYQWSAVRTDGTPFSPAVGGGIVIRDHTQF